MNDDEQKRYLLKRMKEIYRELIVYRALASIAKDNGFQAEVEGEGVKDVDGLLESARKWPSLEKWIDSHFSGLEELLGLESESLLDQALREMLQKTYQGGPIN